MNKEEILQVLKSKEQEIGIMVNTNEGEKWFSRINGDWNTKTFLGFLSYSSEELAKELSEWNEPIISIE